MKAFVSLSEAANVDRPEYPGRMARMSAME